MSYKPRSLFSLLEDMNRSLFLPHIQRPFVWDEDQIQRLFDSLMRNYPIQTFLFWRTRDAIKARRFMPCIEWDAVLSEYYDQARSQEGEDKVFVLDGQQRLQTLYALFAGSTKTSDGKADREAWVDITGGCMSNEDGLLYQIEFSTETLELPMYRIRDLSGRHAQRNAEEIADEMNDGLDLVLVETDEDKKLRQRRVRRNCSQLVSLLREDKYFWVEELDGVINDYPYKRVLEIFVRVNSGGTKLDAPNLMQQT